MVREVPIPGRVPMWAVPGWAERFGVAAGITGKGDGFDLGLRGTTPVGEVLDGWRALGEALCGTRGIVAARQVHGTTVLAHRSDPGPGLHLLGDADGHLTDREGLVLAVSVADCVPVYLIAPGRRVIGLLHAGWRGTAAGILPAAVDRLERDFGVSPSELVAHLGVAISGEAYEVGREVMEGLGLPSPGSGPWHADIRGVLAAQAAGLGITEVTVSGHCTVGQRDLFHSHRGSGGRDGRMVAWLGFPVAG